MFNRTYAAGAGTTGIQYAPHGGISELKLGNNLVETTSYNSRLQPYKLEAKSGATLRLGLDWLHCGAAVTDESCASNNGNVTVQKIRAGSVATFSQTYQYDRMNRLGRMDEASSGAASGSWWRTERLRIWISTSGRTTG